MMKGITLWRPIAHRRRNTSMNKSKIMGKLNINLVPWKVSLKNYFFVLI